MKYFKLSFIFLNVFGLMISANLFAADINFRVPLQYSNLHPQVEKIRVRCEVEGILPANNSSIGVFKVLNPKPNGENTNINLKFSLPKGTTKDKMQRAAACYLEFKKKKVPGFKFAMGNSGNCSKANEWRCSKPNTPYNGSSDVHDLHTK